VRKGFLAITWKEFRHQHDVHRATRVIPRPSTVVHRSSTCHPQGARASSVRPADDRPRSRPAQLLDLVCNRQASEPGCCAGARPRSRGLPSPVWRPTGRSCPCPGSAPAREPASVVARRVRYVALSVATPMARGSAPSLLQACVRDRPTVRRRVASFWPGRRSGLSTVDDRWQCGGWPVVSYTAELAVQAATGCLEHSQPAHLAARAEDGVIEVTSVRNRGTPALRSCLVKQGFGVSCLYSSMAGASMLDTSCDRVDTAIQLGC